MFKRRFPSATTEFGSLPSAAPVKYDSPLPQRLQDVATEKGPYVLDTIGSDGVLVIGKGTRIVGNISDCAKLEILGDLKGMIVADALVIGPGGSVEGDVRATLVEVHGTFQGRMEVADLLDIRSTGRVNGELTYARLAVANGAHLSGTVITSEPTVQMTDDAGSVGESLNGHYHNGSHHAG